MAFAAGAVQVRCLLQVPLVQQSTQAMVQRTNMKYLKVFLYL